MDLKNMSNEKSVSKCFILYDDISITFRNDKPIQMEKRFVLDSKQGRSGGTGSAGM